MARIARSRVVGYGLSAAAVALIAFVCRILAPWIGDDTPLVLFLAAVMAAGWYGGFGPASVTTAIAALVAAFLFTPPVGRLAIAEPSDQLELAVFIAVGLLVSWLCERLHVARRRSEWQSDLLEQTLEPVVVWEMDGGVLYWNRAAEQLYGYARRGAMGRGIQQLLRTRFPDGPEAFRRMLEHEGRWSGELTHTSRDGRELHVESHMRLMEDTEGRRIVLEALRDVTARRRTEDRLRESEARLRLALAGARMDVFDWDVTTDRVRRTRYGLALEGLHVEGTAEEYFALVHSEDRTIFRARDFPASPAQPHYQIEYRIVRPDTGEVAWISERGHAEYDASGALTRVLGVFMDITERKKTEQALSESRHFAQRIASIATAHLYIYDLVERRVVYVNHDLRDVLGYGLEDLDLMLAQRSPTLATEEEFAAIHAHYKAFRELEVDEVRSRTYRMRHRDGSWHWFLARETPFTRDASGQVTQIIGSAVDITDLKLAQDALVEDDRRKDEFLATLAHELRNPLAPITSAVRILQAPQATEEQRRFACGVIDRQVRQLVRLVDDLLDISRITRDKLELKKEIVELREIVDNAVEASAPLIEARGHTLTVSLPGEPILLEVDRIRMAQVVLNLLNNSARYTEPGGRIALEAQRDGAYAVVRVRDTGIGIPAEMMPRVFEMFTQVRDPVDGSQGGLGIGLALVHRLVEMHGGTIQAHSEGPGRGSEFVVRMPLAHSAPIAPPQPASHGGALPPGVDAPHVARRILVVDDNRESADSLATLLRMAGHEVLTAYDGAQAVELAGRVRPELVLMDIGMPRVSGYEACRRIRAEEWGRDITLIAVTGWGQPGDRRDSRAAGFDAHLTKPVELSSLEPWLDGAWRSVRGDPGGASAGLQPGGRGG